MRGGPFSLFRPSAREVGFETRPADLRPGTPTLHSAAADAPLGEKHGCLIEPLTDRLKRAGSSMKLDPIAPTHGTYAAFAMETEGVREGEGDAVRKMCAVGQHGAMRLRRIGKGVAGAPPLHPPAQVSVSGAI